MSHQDHEIRRAAFRALDRLSGLNPGGLPWQEIRRGFAFQDRRFLFAGQAIGIFKPQGMDTVLSIKTTIPRGNRAPRYGDQVQERNEDGLLGYDMQERNPSLHNNQLLLQAYREEIPLIYFQGINPAIYVAHFPVFVKGWDENASTIGIAIGLPYTYEEENVSPPNSAQYQYTQRLSQARVHQAQFRTDVIKAYRARCALSGIARNELIVAAHIIPHAEGGEPVVQNGLCLSHLHHAAFDANLIGIDPDFRVHVSPHLLETNDNALVRANFQNLNRQQIALPVKPEWYPNRARLEQRFAEFTANPS